MAWQTSKLGDVCDLIGGGTPSKSNEAFYEGDIPWATVRDMKDELLSKTELRINQEAVKKSATNVIPAGTVITATRVGLGKVCVLQQDTAINQDLKAIIPKGESLTRGFLFWWLKSVAHLIEDAGTGATVKGVKLPFVKALKIPIPSAEEQKRIVTILDQAFANIELARAKIEQNLKNARELFESTCNNSIFSANSKTNCAVSDVAKNEKGSMRTGPFGSQLLKREIVDEGIAVLGIDNAVNNSFQWGAKRFITPEKFEELSRFEVKAGDVLITIMGTCGRCAIVPENIPKAINTKHICCITLDPSKCLPEYLHTYFLYHPIAREYLLSRAKGAIMAGLNMGIIKELPIVLPSLEEQKRLVSQVVLLKDKVEQLETTYSKKIEYLDELKKSILQKAFSGELTKDSKGVAA